MWSGISPQVLQAVAEDPELAALAAQAIDSAVKASIPVEYHDRADSTSSMRRRQRVPDLAAVADQPLQQPYPSAQIDCPSYDVVDYTAHMFNVAALCNMHWRHSRTCQKGKTGRLRCRLGFPVTLRDSPTGPVQVPLWLLSLIKICQPLFIFAILSLIFAALADSILVASYHRRCWQATSHMELRSRG